MVSPPGCSSNDSSPDIDDTNAKNTRLDSHRLVASHVLSCLNRSVLLATAS